MNGVVRSTPSSMTERMADLAVKVLVDEVELTPKPGLVDRRSSGAHLDLNLGLMLRSAHALRDGFARMFAAACGASLDLALREAVGRIGREAEADMMRATGGVNTHRRAIWAIGLLRSAAAMRPDETEPEQVAQRAADLARLPDGFRRSGTSHGERMLAQYGATGARGEAWQAFPHVLGIGLPALQASRAAGHSENTARLDALIAIIARLDDTCVLKRGGRMALRDAHTLASAIMLSGGTGSLSGRYLLRRLEQNMLSYNASPGGAADLLAATLFLDAIGQRLHI